MKRLILLTALLSALFFNSDISAQFTNQISQVNPQKPGPFVIENHTKDYSAIPGVTISGNTRAFNSGEIDAMNQYTVAYTTGITFNTISVTGNTYPGWRNGTNTDDNLSTATPI